MMKSHCHPEQAFFAKRGIWASRANRCDLGATALIARSARFLSQTAAGVKGKQE